MTLGTFLLASGIFLVLIALLWARASRVALRGTPPQLSDARREEMERFRSESDRYSPYVLRIGIVATIAGLLIVLVALATGA